MLNWRRSPEARRLEQQLDRREQAVVVADALDEAERDVEALDVLLDQDAVGYARSAALSALRQVLGLA